MFPFLTVIYTISLSINGYYISLNSFEQPEAELFCQTHCNSHLASIHSNTQNNELIDLVTYTIRNMNFLWSATPHIYLGLTDKGSEGTYSWTDGSNYNYNNFGSGEPGSNDCLTLQRDTHDWIMNQCNMGQYTGSNKLYLFACNECNGVLTKYMIIDDWNEKYSVAATNCKAVYKTGLASIHGLNDFIDSKYLIELANAQSRKSNLETNAFIGGQSNNGDMIFNWDDGTSFDYGSIFNIDPWLNTQPDGSDNCITMNRNNEYKWKDSGCSNNYMAICNVPSEICDYTEWTTISGTGWSFTTAPCQVTNNYGDDNVAIMDGKRWDNDVKAFVLEYMYTMNSVDATDGGTAGIIWHVNTICANYYYIGISSINSQVFIAETRDDEIDIIQSKSLGFTYTTGTFYALHVSIINGDTFTISVNGNMLLNNIVVNRFSNSGVTDIGYIGIKNTKSSVTTKSLFISGKISLQTNNNIQSWFNACPTSTNPTSDPTSQPTTNPTPSPTSNPTSKPTLSPTIYPTKFPTNNSPTVSSISLDPTTIPSDSPSSYPSIHPTKQPTLSPTHRPTECHDDSTIITISFEYQLTKSEASAASIKSELRSTADELIGYEKMNITGCYISDPVTQIMLNENVSKAHIHISICTNCEESTIEQGLDTKFRDITEQNNDILTVKTDTTIEVEIVNGKNGESAIATTTKTADTTHVSILDGSETKESNSGFWTAISIALVLIFLCCSALCIVCYVKKKRADKIEKENGGKSVSMTGCRIPNKSVTEQVVGDSEVPMDGINNDLTIEVANNNINSDNDLFGEDEDDEPDEEDHTGSVKDKGTDSSHISGGISARNHINGIHDDEVIIAAEDESPGNTESADDTATSGRITGESDECNENVEVNDNVDSDGKYIDMMNRPRGNTDNGMAKKKVDHKRDCLLIKNWLEMRAKLPQYFDIFIENGYDTLDIIKEITEHAQLEEIGIIIKGHQIKIMAEIRKLRGFNVGNNNNNNHNNFIPYNVGYNVELQLNEKDEDVKVNNKVSQVLDEYEGDNQEDVYIENDTVGS